MLLLNVAGKSLPLKLILNNFRIHTNQYLKDLTWFKGMLEPDETPSAELTLLCSTSAFGDRALSQVCDPSKIPGIRRLLRCSRRRRDAGPRTSLHTNSISSKSENRFSKLPPELQIIVLGFLPDIFDFGHAISVFQLCLPDSFWKSWFLRVAVHEVENVSANELDWEFFFMGFKKLLKRCPGGLENRLRIVRILYYTQDRFLELQRQGIDPKTIGPGVGNELEYEREQPQYSFLSKLASRILGFSWVPGR